MRKKLASVVDERAPLLSEAAPSAPSLSEEHKPVPPLRDLLTRSVIISISNYGWLAILDVAHFSLLPLFYALPVKAGGLGLVPRQIGSIMAAYGIACGVIQVLFFAPLHKSLGAKTIHLMGMSSFVAVFACYPVMHRIAQQNGGVTWMVWGVMGIQLGCGILTDMAYSGSTAIFF